MTNTHGLTTVHPSPVILSYESETFLNKKHYLCTHKSNKLK